MILKKPLRKNTKYSDDERVKQARSNIYIAY